MQEHCLSENQFAECEEDRFTTNIGSFGEDYGRFIRILENNSSDESLFEVVRSKKRMVRKGGSKKQVIMFK